MSILQLQKYDLKFIYKGLNFMSQTRCHAPTSRRNLIQTWMSRLKSCPLHQFLQHIWPNFRNNTDLSSNQVSGPKEEVHGLHKGGLSKKDSNSYNFWHRVWNLSSINLLCGDHGPLPLDHWLGLMRARCCFWSSAICAGEIDVRDRISTADLVWRELGVVSVS